MRCVNRKRSVAGATLLFLLTWSVGAMSAEGPSPKSTRLPRAYEGAPPLIPHDVEARKGVCLACHATGENGAPITPHPTRTHFCLQCHVGQDLTVQPFVKKRTN
jgi:nitrate reductase cytochrome c-type subunit